MAHVHDEGVLSVRRVGSMPVSGDDAAHEAVVEGEATKLPCEQDDGEPLVLVAAHRS